MYTRRYTHIYCIKTHTQTDRQTFWLAQDSADPRHVLDRVQEHDQPHGLLRNLIVVIQVALHGLTQFDLCVCIYIYVCIYVRVCIHMCMC